MADRVVRVPEAPGDEAGWPAGGRSELLQGQALGRPPLDEAEARFFEDWGRRKLREPVGEGDGRPAGAGRAAWQSVAPGRIVPAE